MKNEVLFLKGNSIMTIEERKYPIGKPNLVLPVTDERRAELIAAVRSLPDRVREVAALLGDDKLDLRYREGGWTARQVIHHIPESHMHAYTRLKFALTEDNPQIKPYNEVDWTDRADMHKADIEPSLRLIEGLQLRLAEVFEHLSESERKRTFFHPASQKTYTLDQHLATYAWHGDHHLGHLKIIAGGLGVEQ
ncbi:MAG: putative metal-dependent hydrolase [Flavobacteriales bacterium]|nr:putative metal-dependent hydrolase [Flavobacteriales bacterium]